ncbi:MAG: CPBP family intramembrane metalloprotease [Bacteroidales bacterium]|nr:CPBP family intramembrane metalloprotease [Bacteroidales bacterium]
MDRKTVHLCAGMLAAALLWFYMFSPWTSGLSGFWLNMSISAVILGAIAISGSGGFRMDWGRVARQLPLGLVIAFALWGIFLIGDKLSSIMFDFARGQVNDIYALREGSSPVLVSLLLLLLIGPVEEYFWRGYVQKGLSERMGATAAMLVTAAVYALVHVWSFNFMLVAAAFVAGGVWGLIYRLRPSLLPALVVSHAVWDALVFVILPI